MAFNNVIPNWVIHELLRDYQYQLPLYTPEYWIEEEHCTDVADNIKCIKSETGSNWSSQGRAEHPSFIRLREHLGAKGYISIERGWHNGDRVLRKFILNDVTFEPGDKFLCASAMRWKLFKK